MTVAQVSTSHHLPLRKKRRARPRSSHVHTYIFLARFALFSSPCCSPLCPFVDTQRGCLCAYHSAYTVYSCVCLRACVCGVFTLSLQSVFFFLLFCFSRNNPPEGKNRCMRPQGSRCKHPKLPSGKRGQRRGGSEERSNAPAAPDRFVPPTDRWDRKIYGFRLLHFVGAAPCM